MKYISIRKKKLIAILSILSMLSMIFPVIPILAGSVTSVSETLTTYATGATPTHTLAFTTATDVAVSGTITFTFPSGFDLTGVVDGDVTETLTAGTATWAVSGQMTADSTATPVS